MKRILATLVFLCLTASASLAADNPKTIFIGLQLASGTADLATEASTGFGGTAPAYDHSEYGFKFEYWNMMAADYALTASAGVGLFSEEDKVGTNGAPGDGTQKYTQSSWNVRVGGDRVVKVSDRAYLFFGPGLEYWTGKAKFEDATPPASTYETESVTRFSLHGRMGAHMMIGEAWGITLQTGHKIGMASYEENGAKTTWWPSSMDASGGLVFQFGGK